MMTVGNVLFLNEHHFLLPFFYVVDLMPVQAESSVSGTFHVPVASPNICKLLWISPAQDKQSLVSKQIDLRGKEPEKGVLMSHTVTDLEIPRSYEVRLAPITTYSTGDYVSRIILYSERKSLSHPFFCKEKRNQCLSK